MAAPEFIYLNEQAVRVTGWKQDDDSGTIEFVVIAQGETDRDLLLDIFSREPVMVRLGNRSAIPMDVRSLDTRASSEGSRTTYRLQVALWPEGSAPAARTVEAGGADPVDPIAARLDHIIKLLTEIRNEVRFRQ
jgi:hypothetical protein